MDAKLLNKYIAGDALPEEKKEVIRWMKESEENREQLMQLHRVYNATIWNGNLQAEKNREQETCDALPLGVYKDSRRSLPWLLLLSIRNIRNTG